MKVFVSWSGDLSRTAAESLKKFLPCMIQGLEVFVSKHDLESGGRWGPQLASELEGSSFGIICLTADNQAAPWILYEAGALTKLADGRACGLLLDGLTPANVAGPLAQFQHRRMVDDEFFLLFRDLNQRLPTPLKDDQLRMVFSKWWPDVDAEYKVLLAKGPTAAKTSSNGKPGTRDDRELLEEILERVRAMPSSRVLSAFGSADLTNATRALLRVIRARPQSEIDLLLEINRLKDEGMQDAVEEMAILPGQPTQNLVDAGLLWRNGDGKLMLNRFVGDTVLPALKASLSNSGARSRSESE
jgi:TIR domain